MENSENLSKCTAQWLAETNKIINLRILFKGNYVGHSPEWIFKFIKEHFVQKIHFAYEWYALYKFLNDRGYLKIPDMSKFAEQMNLWYDDAGVCCSQSELARYNFLSGIPVNNWANFRKNEPTDKISNIAVSRIFVAYTNLINIHDALLA